jgi:hypothetical protein
MKAIGELVGLCAVLAPHRHGGVGDVVDPGRALGAEGLDALVVAVAGAAAVADHAQAAGGGGQQHLGGVDIAQRADLRIDQARGPGEHLDRPLAQQPGRQVEVVDGEVLEQAAAGRDEGRGRGGRVVVDDVETFQRADVAAVDPGLQGAVVRVEAAVEGHEQAVLGLLQLALGGQQGGQVQVERLLAEHLLARPESG